MNPQVFPIARGSSASLWFCGVIGAVVFALGAFLASRKGVRTVNKEFWGVKRRPEPLWPARFPVHFLARTFFLAPVADWPAQHQGSAVREMMNG
jgi:hypothetical protein